MAIKIIENENGTVTEKTSKQITRERKLRKFKKTVSVTAVTAAMLAASSLSVFAANTENSAPANVSTTTMSTMINIIMWIVRIAILAIGGAFGWVGQQVSNAIWDAMLQWYYETIYNAIADFFTQMGNMGAELFDLPWIQATIDLFILLGWSLYAAGVVVAIFDVAIEYQNGRANIKTTALNILKGFFACSLIGVVPVELYKFCITLQNTFAKDLSAIMAGTQTLDLSGTSTGVLEGCFSTSANIAWNLLNLLCMIAFAYCVVKIFFANIKRGGILLIQMAVGSLYMFSVPRGYQDGFNQWMKQVAA